MAAFRVEEDADHDGVRLVVRPSVWGGPWLARMVMATAAGALVAGLLLGTTAVVWLLLYVLAALAAVAPLAWLAIGRRGTVLSLNTRDLVVGAVQVRVEDIRSVAEGHGTVRISTGDRTFEVGHDWPPEWRQWLVQRTETAMHQRERQLRSSGPEQLPPAALEALRGREEVD